MSPGLGKSLKGLKIGLPKEYFISGTDPEIDHAVREAIKVLESFGATTRPISLPNTDHCLSVYYILAPSEASSNLSRFDGVRYGHRTKDAKNLLEFYEKSRGEGFGPEVKRRIMIGTYALSSGYYDAYYAKAQKVRTLVKQDFDNAFKEVDIIATPTSPSPAFKIGEKSSDPLQMYLSDIFTISCNLAGLPGLSLPCGFTKTKLPIGLQLLGRPFEEGTLLSAAHHYEQAKTWNTSATVLQEKPAFLTRLRFEFSAGADRARDDAPLPEANGQSARTCGRRRDVDVPKRPYRNLVAKKAPRRSIALREVAEEETGFR